MTVTVILPVAREGVVTVTQCQRLIVRQRIYYGE